MIEASDGPGTRLTRREAIKGAAAVAGLGAGSGLLSGARATAAARGRQIGADAPGATRDRVAIIGAGAGGVAATYFLADTFDVDLFEARDKIGGHCDSRVIEYQGQPVIVDIGAQFFHPDTHPIYVTLLALLGLYDPAQPDSDETLEAPGSLCVFQTAGSSPVFSSSHPFMTPVRALGFARYSQLARDAVLSNLSWDTTVDEWIRGLSISQSFKNEIVYPWITALIGSTPADARQASARSILQTFALAFPADILKGATTYNSAIGLQGNLQRMLDLSPTAALYLSAPAQSLSLGADGWSVVTPAGQSGPYRYVVLNAPPHAGRQIVGAVPELSDVATLLDSYGYFDSRLAIHTDPAYVYPDRSYWAAYNAEVTGGDCEGSVWLGALDPKLQSGATIDVFKSWATRRPTQPSQVLAERWFKHPLIDESMLQAARGLEPLQGRDGLYFSGVYTTGFDSQESAVYSAMKVAESMAPASPTLASLQAMLAANGLAGISYDL